jgi:hypothetical protein
MFSYAWLMTSFCIISWFLGTPAMRCASAATVLSSCFSGTASTASPQSLAVGPSIRSPVNSICLARCAPIRYTHIAVVGQPHTRAGM